MLLYTHTCLALAYQSITTVDYFKNKKTLSNQTPNIKKKEKKYHFQTTLLSQTAVQQNLIQRFCNFFCTSIITVSFFFVSISIFVFFFRPFHSFSFPLPLPIRRQQHFFPLSKRHHCRFLFCFLFIIFLMPFLCIMPTQQDFNFSSYIFTVRAYYPFS